MSDTPNSISFSIYRQGELVDEVEIVRPVINVGKLSTSTLRVDDVSVSRKHAVIERRESGGWRITDLGSTNGTQVNDKTIVQTTLSDGDRITLGECVLVVHLRESTDKEAGPVEPRAEAPTGGAIRGLGQDTFYDQRAQRDSDGPMGLEVALLWGETVLSIEHFSKPEIITVGEERGCRFALPSEALGVSTFPLVVPQGSKFALNLQNSAITGDILVDGKVVGLDDLRQGGESVQFFTLDGNMRARLRTGEFTILVSHGPLSRGPKAGVVSAWELAPLIFFLVSFILHSAFMVTLNMLPEEELKSHLDPTSKRAQIVKAMKMAKEKEKKKEKDEKKEEKKDEKKLKAEKKKDGKAAKRIIKVDKPVEKDNPFRNLDSKKKQNKIKELMNNSETSSELDNLAELMKPPNEGVDFKIIGIADASADPGEHIDPFGADSGGYDDVGMESIGFDRAGSGGGMVSGLGKRTDGPNVGNVDLTRVIQPKVVGGVAQVSGRLDRQTVKKYIRRKLGGIKRCYSDSLQRDSKSQGRLNLGFSIRPNGTITKVLVTGMERDVVLTACVKNRMKIWKFPNPKSGGLIKVKYPVVLKAANRR